jgi:hypothetical protein
MPGFKDDRHLTEDFLTAPLVHRHLLRGSSVESQQRALFIDNYPAEWQAQYNSWDQQTQHFALGGIVVGAILICSVFCFVRRSE